MRRRSTNGKDGSKRRHNFKPEQRDILMGYVFNNLQDCYPTAAEKEELANKTGLGLTQVNDFFINARRRYVPRLQREKGLVPSGNPRKRKAKNEDGVVCSTKRMKMSSSEPEEDTDHESVEHSLSPGSSPASTRDENDEVFLPDHPTGPLPSSESELLKELIPSSFKPGVDSLCIQTEQYQRQDGSASSSHSVFSSSPSPSSSLSPSHYFSDDSTSKSGTHTTEEVERAKQCDNSTLKHTTKEHTIKEREAADGLLSLRNVFFF